MEKLVIIYKIYFYMVLNSAKFWESFFLVFFKEKSSSKV